MKRVSSENLERCKSLEDLWDLQTSNGSVVYSGLEDVKSVKSRYNAFKKYLEEILPNLTQEQILLFDEYFQDFRKIYDWYNADFFLACLTLENHGKQV